MNIQRHHTYAAKALQQVLHDEGLTVPPLTELEQDFPRVLAELQAHASHHEKHAALIDVLRKLGHWSDT